MSSKVELKDRSGQSVQVNYVDGFYFHRGATPIPFHEHLTRVKQMPIRSDDVLVCSYPKSGTHWLWEMVNMLTKGDLQYRSHIEAMNQPDFKNVDVLEELSSPRVLGTHFRFRFLPKQVLENKTKIIFLEHNPKMIAVTFYSMTVGLKSVEGYAEDGLVKVKEYNGSWEDYFEMFLAGRVPYGSWFDYTLEWEEAKKSHPSQPILDVRFEDMKKNAVACIEKIAEFLGLSITRERAETIAVACSFKNMKRLYDKNENKGIELKEEMQTVTKGKSGDWRVWFTVAQNERFDQVYEAKMGRHVKY